MECYNCKRYIILFVKYINYFNEYFFIEFSFKNNILCLVL